MDDKRFDDIIKNKADGFVDSGHDAQALTDFRRRMADLPKKTSGFSFGNSRTVVGSLILFTLLNFGLLWYYSEGRHVGLKNEIHQLQTERAQLISLETELERVRSLNTSRVDTVYIVEERFTTLAANTTGSTESPNVQSKSTENDQEYTYQYLGQGQPAGNEILLQLQNDRPLSEELEHFLARNNLLLRANNEELILVVDNSPKPVSGDRRVDQVQYLTKTRTPQYLPEVATFEQPEPREKPESKKIPTRVLWAMEKHKHTGVDVQFGIEGKYHKSNFEVGSGDKNGGVGFMTELIFSPTIRLETGIHIGARSYKIKKSEIETLPEEFFQRYPGYDDQLGELIALESDADLVKIPLNLKYFGIIDHNKRWYLSGGLTPQWSTRQELDYKYALDVPEPPIGDTEFVSFVGSKQELSSSYYTTTVNLGVGTEVYLNERLRWQLGVFYQKGLGNAGAENIKLNNSFGIKTSIWFNNP